MAKTFKSSGVTLAAPPGGYLVKSTKGPLLEGEETRAAAWIKGIASGTGA